MENPQDAFGHMMYDHLHGKRAFEIIERDDGLFNIGPGPALYFAGYAEWMPIERESMRFAAGRVLDIGCGAGRHALYLQQEGFEVVGIDSSPLAVQICRELGLRDVRLLPLERISKQLGLFDTVLMMGNNFGLLGTPKRARWLLKRFAGLTSPEGRIVAFTRNPYQTDLPEHLAYHAWNRERGRMSGQARIRVRYKKYISKWMDFLMVSPEEMEEILEPTPWKTAEILEGEGGLYCAILKKREQKHGKST